MNYYELDDEKELPPPGHPLNALATRLGELLPLDDRYTDWQKWLGFARAAYEAGATDEREACANVCDANAKHWREMYTTANPRAAELVLRGYSAREDSAADCATNIRERSNA